MGLAAAAAGPTAPELLSRAPGNQGADARSSEGAVTPSGRFVAFESRATNLLDGGADTNGAPDIFVRDRRRGVTTRVSVSSGGVEGNGFSQVPAISANGRFVLFESFADNLVPDDGNAARDVFVHDRRTGETRRVSEAADGAGGDGHSRPYGASLSASGRYAVFHSGSTNLVPGDANGVNDAFLKDLRTGAVTIVSRAPDGGPADGHSSDPSLSPNGRYVAYDSRATNLVPGDANDASDVLVFDRKTGVARRASVASDGTEGDGASYDPVVSNDGAVVAFYSYATNLVEGDTNASSDVFVHDFRSGETRRVSVDADGNQVTGDSYYAALSQDGKTLVFYTEADGLVPEDANGTADVYAVDLVDGSIRLLSTNAQGEAGNGFSFLYAASLSINGRWCVFASAATNLVPQDPNGATDDEFLVPAR